jgi:hypothetical protein
MSSEKDLFEAVDFDENKEKLEHEEEKYLKEMDNFSNNEIDENSIKQLSVYCEKLKNVREVIKEKKEYIKKLEEIEDKLSSILIPDILLMNGLSSLKLSNGDDITIKEDISISIPVEDFSKRLKAFQFIESLKGGKFIIKNEFRIDFDRNNDESLIKIKDDLKKYLLEKNIQYNEDKQIHSMTLKSYIKEVLGYKKGIPAETTFDVVKQNINSLFRIKKTEIKNKEI